MNPTTAVLTMRKVFRGLTVTAVAALLVTGCEKEYSLEEGGGGGINIIGDDCRITKIACADSASGVSLGAITANINSADQATTVTDFDSLNNTLLNTYTVVYSNDTVYINAAEYFVLDPVTKRVMIRHGQVDPTDPLSPEIDVDYSYDAQGYLIGKEYSFSATGITYRAVAYQYTSGNMVRMVDTDLTTGELSTDANLQYGTLAPKSYMYLFPDEKDYEEFSQFMNFGRKPVNNVTAMVVRNYDPITHTPSDSLVSAFVGYVLSADKYVLSCYMNGDNQPSIPAQAGKLSFSYKCR